MSQEQENNHTHEIPPDLSVVIPVFNGATTVGKVVRSVIQGLPTTKLEIVLVDDGSTDDSALICEALVGKFRDQVRYIQLDGNHGEHNAVLAGLHFAAGNWVAVMDDDGQNTSNALSELYRHAQKTNVDVVYGGYRERKHNWFRKLGSYAAQQTSQLILKTPQEVYLSSFKLMKQTLVQKILHDAPANPYIDGLVFQENPSWEMIYVEHQDRLAGESNYTLRRLVSLWLNIFITADRSQNLSLVRGIRAASVLGLAGLAAFWIPWVLALAVVFPKTSLGLLLLGAWAYGWCGWVLLKLTEKMDEELSGVDPFTISKKAGRLINREIPD